MPKCYSEEEKMHIRIKLKAEAARCLSMYGARKTTVDEIVDRVRIPKGTFYLFYPSKEKLLMEVLQESKSKLMERLRDHIKKIKDTKNYTEELTRVLYEFMKESFQTPIVKALNSEDFYLIARKLNPEMVQNELESGYSLCKEVLKHIPVRKDIDLKTFAAAFQCLYAAALQANRLGLNDELFDATLHLTIRGLVLQLS